MLPTTLRYNGRTRHRLLKPLVAIDSFTDAAPRRVQPLRTRDRFCQAYTLPGSLPSWLTAPVRCASCEVFARGSQASGAEGIRTPDFYSAIVALSQLSYSPGVISSLSSERAFVKS